MGEPSQSPIVITGPIEVEAITTIEFCGPVELSSGFVRISRYRPTESDLNRIFDAFHNFERLEFSIRNARAIKRADFGGYIQKASTDPIEYWPRFINSGVTELILDVVIDGELKTSTRKWPRKARAKAKAPKISNPEDIKSLAHKFTS